MTGDCFPPLSTYGRLLSSPHLLPLFLSGAHRSSFSPTLPPHFTPSHASSSATRGGGGPCAEIHLNNFRKSKLVVLKSRGGCCKSRTPRYLSLAQEIDLPLLTSRKETAQELKRCLCNQIKRSRGLQNIPETERVLLLLWSTHARLCCKERVSNRFHTCLPLFLSVAKRL